MFRGAASLTISFALMFSASVHASESDAPAAAGPSPTVTVQLKRPAALSTMYGTFAALQVLDVVSTRRALAAGAREVNPVMGSGGLGRMTAMKAATGTMAIYFAERAWKKNRIGAIVVMAAINGATAAVVAHNTRVARR